MPPKKIFYQVFSKDPPACDVVRNDNLISLEPCIFRYEKTIGKKDFEEASGEIKQQGLKKDLDCMKLDSDGQPCAANDPRKVGTRKQELEKLRMAQVNAQRLQLQLMAEQLLDDGADAVTGQLQPVVKQKRPSLPKKRPPKILTQLQNAVKEMPCFKPGPLKTQIYKDVPLYCDAGKLQVAKLKYSRRPKDLHLALLHLLVTKRILRLDGFSVAGKRGCVAIDPIINETISLLVLGTYVKTGGKQHDKEMQYNPDELLRDLIDNTRRLHGTWRFMDTPTNVNPTSSPSTPSTSSALICSSASPSSAPLSPVMSVPNPSPPVSSLPSQTASMPTPIESAIFSHAVSPRAAASSYMLEPCDHADYTLVDISQSIAPVEREEEVPYTMY